MEQRAGHAAAGGPSGSAEWLTLGGAAKGSRLLHALPEQQEEEDYESPEPERFYLVGSPVLSREPSSGRPLISLTLILERPPKLDEDDTLDDLVTGGVLALDLSIAPSDEEVERSALDLGREVRPLFVRQARWALLFEPTGERFAEATVFGNGRRAAFSQTVSREIALAALAALRERDSDIAILCEADFRAAGAIASENRPTMLGGTTLTVTTSSTGSLRTVSLESKLGDTVREAAARLPFEAVVKAVCPAPDGSLEPIPWRVESRATRDRRSGVSDLASVEGVAAAWPALLKTSQGGRINAHALIASNIADRLPGKLGRWQVADLVLAGAATPDDRQPLPVIEGEAALWPDRINDSKFWFAPELAVVDPPPAGEATGAPFLFSFRVIGNGTDGPILEATVKVTVRGVMPADAKAAWDALGKPECTAVPLNGLSAMLVLPFVDENGRPSETSIAATEITPVIDGHEIVFTLTDLFARLAYGVLGTRDFQPSPARVDLAYCFPAYVPVERTKALNLGRRPFVRPHLAAAAALHPVASHALVSHAVAAPVQPSAIATLHPVWMGTIIPIRPKIYGIRTQGRRFSPSLFVPCSTFGHLYLQRGDPAKGEEDRTIGCRDAWTLGRLQLSLYEPLDIDLGLGNVPYSVFRSLAVAGRFLVLPRAYTITRYEPGDWRAYRPALFLYSSIDANRPEQTNCILTGTLRPAVTPAERRLLLDALRSKVRPNASIIWPTDLGVEPEVSWALPAGAARITPAAAQTPEGFQISLGAGIDHILTLKSLVERSGITASVRYTLPDGTMFRTSLVIDLARIDGPFESGAVSAVAEGARAVITNHSERAAEVGELIAARAVAPSEIVAVEQTLGPRQSATVDGVAGAKDYAVGYSLSGSGGSLEEVRSFVEDLHTRMVFVAAFDLTAAGLERIAVEALYGGVAGAGTVALTAADPSAEMAFVLPLTTYLAEPTLRYRATGFARGGAARTGAWRDWKPHSQGNVVELSPAHLSEVSP